ncbi:MAG: ribosome maturation factor RimM [Synechococcales cyanobacterium]
MTSGRIIAQIMGVHGIRGVLKARLLSDFPERLTTPGRRWLHLEGEDPRPVTLLKGTGQPDRGGYLLTFAECCDRTTAEGWVGGRLGIPEDDRPTLAAEDYYVPDLIGVRVYQEPGGEPVGLVVGVIQGTAQDLLDIQIGEERKLLPFVRALVPDVNLAARTLVIAPPPGW